MAEKEISTLIQEQQEIICLLKPLIEKQEDIKTRLDNIITEIKKHHLDCNIARGFGAGAAAAGTVLAAIPVGQPVTTGIGLLVTLAGKLIAFVTDCADEVKSKTFNKNTIDIVALQNNLAENLKEKLNYFQMFLETIQSNRSKEMLENTGLNSKERFESQRSSLVKSHSDICGSISTDIDFESLVNSFKDRFNEVKNLVNIVKMSETLLPTVAAALQAIGVQKEIEKVIQSWKKKHPSEEAVHKILGRLLESNKALRRLRKDIEENVEMLEKRLPVIKAIETYEKVSGLVNPLILKQNEAVKWILKELDEISNKHWIIWIILMFVLAFVAPILSLGLFEEIRFGSLIIVAICLLFAIFAAFYGNKPSKPAVEKMLNELKCPKYPGIKAAPEHKRLSGLLESVDKTSDRLRSQCLKEGIDFTPPKSRPIHKAAKSIGDKIHGGFAMKKSSSKQLCGMQGLLAEASVILETIWKLDDIGYVIGCWAANNNIQNRLVSQLPNDTIDYTKSIDKLLEVLQTRSEKHLTDKLQ